MATLQLLQLFNGVAFQVMFACRCDDRSSTITDRSQALAQYEPAIRKPVHGAGRYELHTQGSLPEIGVSSNADSWGYAPDDHIEESFQISARTIKQI
ncbi:MAG: hypothetical protein ABW161_16020 [Candidatus Thiodiazotropha sp.]